MQQENHIHRVAGLVVRSRKEGWWEALLQSFSPLSRSYHVSFSLCFPSSPAYCRYFCSWLSPVSLLRSLLSLFSSCKSSCKLHKYERAFFGVVVCATLDLFPRCFSVFHLDNHGSWEHQRRFCLCSLFYPFGRFERIKTVLMGTNTPHTCIPGLVWQKQARRFSQFEFKVGELRFPIHFVCVSAALYHRGVRGRHFPLRWIWPIVVSSLLRCFCLQLFCNKWHLSWISGYRYSFLVRYCFILLLGPFNSSFLLAFSMGFLLLNEKRIIAIHRHVLRLHCLMCFQFLINVCIYASKSSFLSVKKSRWVCHPCNLKIQQLWQKTNHLQVYFWMHCTSTSDRGLLPITFLTKRTKKRQHALRQKRTTQKISLENPGIDPGTSRMLSERSTMWANSPRTQWPWQLNFLQATFFF